MFRIVDLDKAPRIDATAHQLAVDFNLFLGAHNGEWKKCLGLGEIYGRNKSTREAYTKLAVVSNGIFIILLNIVREVVHRNTVMLNVFHDLCNKVINKAK